MKCVIWNGFKDREGYGRKYLPRSENAGKSKYIPAHRWVYQEAYGKVEKDMVVMHICDNPSCVNLEHLTLGTQRDNIRDMWSKKRSYWQTHCNKEWRKGWEV